MSLIRQHFATTSDEDAQDIDSAGCSAAAHVDCLAWRCFGPRQGLR